ncbi:flavodoxin I [Fistulifera solaris]|uniref:Flavodoxin I n=1 Tax=Fistulifera solaris TaxID=1519565 RepID=A0A1Z5KTE5_FISSO|nr:flavodoxin I [Fistulifera solaris]|eukprot:GAX29355.1 flavodoxin I [Fistulifera solaris]
MLRFGKYFFFVSFVVTATDAWGILPPAQRFQTRLDAAVGIFYGTSTGSTSDAAELIYEAFGADVAAEPVDVDTLDKGALADAFGQHDALIVGTPTWNTGANTERSGTGWDELYYSKMPALKAQLDGKKVAVFGLGDQVSYSENYADATGELWDVFHGLGCTMLGAWSQEGYEHEASKSIRGDKFCGLLLDAVNQEELTGERVQQWVAQLIEEGILDGSSSVAKPSTATSSASPKAVEEEIPELKEMAASSRILDENIALHSSGGFKAHVNPVSGKTMWTSADGRKSFTTVGTVKKATKP